MAARPPMPPRFKIYKSDGEYIASCKYPEDAAAIVALNGEGTTIRDGHPGRILWFEGREDQPATESWDFVATTVHQRLNGGYRA